MGMEPFDYLTYKKNKQPTKQNRHNRAKKEKLIVSIICAVTFILIFIWAMSYIGSKSSKIDIEYGRLGENSAINSEIEEEEDIKEENVPRDKYTIDKRLFLIQQEEKGPSESKIISKAKEQAEVISKSEFDIIKTNSDEVTQKAEKQSAAKASENTAKEENKSNSPQTEKPDAKQALPSIKPVGAFETHSLKSKVLIGKYPTMEEAKETQSNLSGINSTTPPFIRKMSNYYTVQVGSYESYDTAKAVAGKLRNKGYDVWIFQ